MSCKNHPLVDAVANCERCDTPMCDQCANHTEAGILCEACVKIRENEHFVAAQAERSNPQTGQLLAEAANTLKPELSKTGQPRRNPVKLFIIAVGSIAVYAGLYAYSHPSFLAGDSEARTNRLAAAALVDCLWIFQEIGELLEENQMPDPALRCDESDTANIITRDGGTIRISHPNPEFHGYSEIFVTNHSHEPTLVE